MSEETPRVMDIRFWGPVEDGEKMHGRCFELRNELRISEEEKAEIAADHPAFIGFNRGSVVFYDKFNSSIKDYLAREGLIQLNQCCGYEWVPCCDGWEFMEFCVPEPYVWYRLIYACNKTGYICWHQIYFKCC